MQTITKNLTKYYRQTHECSNRCDILYTSINIYDKCVIVVETVRRWCRTVRTLRHQPDGAEMSWVRSVFLTPSQGHPE